MTTRWFIPRPPTSFLVQWTGDNVSEFESHFPGRTYTVTDGSLVENEMTVIPLNSWYDGLSAYPTVPEWYLAGMQEVPADGPYVYTVELA